jgi:hypothetical protein
LTQNAAHRNGTWPVHEVNHDLEFIELSWVAVPAFGDAHVLEKIASVKRAVDNGFKPEDSQEQPLSDEEKQILSFAKAKNDLVNESRVPEALKSVAEAAACKNEECAFDPRKTADSKQPVKVAGEMRRINITYDDTKFRRTSKDYGAEGKVVIDGKDFEWWGSSSDKSVWMISLEKDLGDLLSAKGQKQLIDGITQLIQKNLDSTELIVAKQDINMKKTGYAQNFEDDENMEGKRIDKMLKDQDKDRHIYDNKTLEVPGLGDVRDFEQKAFEETAKEGPSGALGKPLAKKDETLNHEELKLKEEMRRAYVNYLAGRTKKS